MTGIHEYPWQGRLLVGSSGIHAWAWLEDDEMVWKQLDICGSDGDQRS